MKEKNYNSFLGMNDGDILAFYAAFSRDGYKIYGYYFFAYFVVDRVIVIAWGCLGEISQEEDQALVRNNHHSICKRADQVVVVGKPDKSKVFKRAVLLSSRATDKNGSNYYPCQSIRGNLDGYYKPMNLSSLRKMPGEIAESFKEYLDLHYA